MVLCCISFKQLTLSGHGHYNCHTVAISVGLDDPVETCPLHVQKYSQLKIITVGYLLRQWELFHLLALLWVDLREQGALFAISKLVPKMP